MQETAEQLSKIDNLEQINYFERYKNDTETWLAETLNGSMRSRFEYCLDGDELYGEDGGELGVIFDDAIEAAQTIAEQNPNLLYELRRRLIEKGEYQDMLTMAKGELVDDEGNDINTMVVVSDFPDELMDSKTDIGGYNAVRKQTMLRVITRQPNGKISMTTQSLDGSNRQALESIYYQFGETPEDGELLEQRIYRSLPEQWQDHVVDNITKIYDQSLAEQNGGVWHAGIELPSLHENENTYEFARDQTDLIEWFVTEKLRDPVAAEKLRFKLAATASQRFENKHQKNITTITKTEIQGYVSQSMLHEIELATKQATIEGKVFSGCGATISAEGQMKEAGYGNKTGETTDYKFDKKMYCVVCQKSPKSEEPKKPCGPCGICRGCDSKLSGKG